MKFFAIFLFITIGIVYTAAYRQRWMYLFTTRDTTARSKYSLYATQKSNDCSLETASRNLFIAAVSFVASMQLANARPEGVSRPDLLPKGEKTNVIDVAKFLSKGQEKRIEESIAKLEKETGYKLRIVCQSYPETPGLAIKDYWGVDDNTLIMVVDRGEGLSKKGIPRNMINLNLGANLEQVLPNQFWTRVIDKLGNQFYVRKVGEDTAVLNAVEAITYCLQTKECLDLPFQVQQ